MNSCYPLFLLLLFTAGVRAQTANGLSYYPLEVGNSWTYFEVLEPPDAPVDTIWRGSYSIDEAISVNDTLYYLADYPFSMADTLREDALGRIWTRIDGRESLLFDFTLPERGVYHFRPGAPYEDLDFQVSIERSDTVKVAAGRFANVVSLQFDDPQVVDEAVTYVFAPDIGIVDVYGGLGVHKELLSAKVGGKVIANVEEEEPILDGAYAYPNPFGESTTIVAPFAGVAPLQEAVVYDALGRRIATLVDGDCRLYRCSYEWSGSRFPAGTYYARFKQDELSQTVKLILAR